MSQELSALTAIQKKLEYYCVYQDRCHQEVQQKLWDFGLSTEEKDLLVVHLITNNFLNEERFARSFARGKHRIMHWGKIRIINEMKFRNVSAPNIKSALTEISTEEYQKNFTTLSERLWDSLRESDKTKKHKKFCDYLLRKGWESNLVYDKLKELSQ